MSQHWRLEPLIIKDESQSNTGTSSNCSRSCRVKRLFEAILFLVISITLTVSITLSVYNLIKYKESKDETTRGSGFCVMCSELYPEGYVDRRAEETIASLERHMDDGVQICCARNNSERSQIMRLQLKRRDSLTYPRIFNSSKIDTDSFNFGSISAHKILTYQVANDKQSKAKFGDEFYQLRLREYNDARFEHVSGVDVTPFGMKVKVAGLYFVYKSVFFVPDSGHPCKHFKEQTFYSLLLRNSTLRHSRKDVLLRSEHTCCPDCVQNRETSFTGGIFYLDEGDLIEVEISAYGFVYFKPDVTYMGLIIISADA